MKNLRELREKLIDEDTSEDFIRDIGRILELRLEEAKLKERINTIKSEMVSGRLSLLSFSVPELSHQELVIGVESSKSVIRDLDKKIAKELVESFIENASKDQECNKSHK